MRHLKSSNELNLAHAPHVDHSCLTARTSTDCDKACLEKQDQADTLHLGFYRLR